MLAESMKSLFFFLIIAAPLLVIAEPHEKARFMGTGSCASSNCHGSAAPLTTSSVLQNEYTVWSKHDKHAKAWLVLKEPEAQRIGEHLGIKDVASEPWCLKCHATYVADAAMFSSTYKLEDGVTCETCHGAAENYLKEHAAKGASHARNLELGLRDLVPLNTRAEFCLTCHYGSEDASVSHRLIGAGHPRLSFELDTYSMLQPYHWKVDSDYMERKADYNNARAWLIGQVELGRSLIAALQSESRSKHGPLPELSLLTCYSCHHSLGDQQWKTREYEGRPGELRLNTAALFMLQHAAAALKLSGADELGNSIEALELAYAQQQLTPATKNLAQQLDKISVSIKEIELNTKNLKALLHMLANSGSKMKQLPYETAEQIAMGMSAVLASFGNSGQVYQAKLDAVYTSLKTPHEFQPEVFRKSCNDLASRLDQGI